MDRENTTPGFPRSEQSLRPFPQTGVLGGAATRGWAAGLLRPRGPGPPAVAVAGSGCPGCWPKLLSGHLLHLRKRRMGFPGRKARQGRWPGQVALVSRFPAAVRTAHPTEPCHCSMPLLPPCNQTPWPGEAAMRLLIGGLRAMATGGCLLPAHQPGPPSSPPRWWAGAETLQRDRDLDERARSPPWAGRV